MLFSLFFFVLGNFVGVIIIKIFYCKRFLKWVMEIGIRIFGLFKRFIFGEKVDR